MTNYRFTVMPQPRDRNAGLEPGMCRSRERRSTGCAPETDALRFISKLSCLMLITVMAGGLITAAENPPQVTVDWTKVLQVSKTTSTLQVVVNPPLRRSGTIHDPAFRALHDLGCDVVRYVPWLPYPRLAVAELEPPKDGKTSWDFSLIDPMTEDFLQATAGHSVMLNFSTIPQWMFKTPKLVATVNALLTVGFSHRWKNPRSQQR